MSYGELRETFEPGPSSAVSFELDRLKWLTDKHIKFQDNRQDMVKQNDGQILGPLEIDVSEIVATTYADCTKKMPREHTESLRHRMALSDGAVIAMCYNSGTGLRPMTTSKINSGGDSCAVCPNQMSRRNKGKPENVCQLMAVSDHKASIGSRRVAHETRNEKTLAKGRSVSVTTFGGPHDLSGSGSGSTFAAATMSLKQFASQLRSPRFFEPLPNLKYFVPYTPPPMLSPMRRGSGLFWKISQTPPSKVNIAQSSEGNNCEEAESRARESRRESETDEEPVEKRFRRSFMSTLQTVKETSGDGQQQQIGTPTRKNGLCYSSQFFDVCSAFFSVNGNLTCNVIMLPAKLLRLEALRKESDISWNSSTSSGIPPSGDLPSPSCKFYEKFASFGVYNCLPNRTTTTLQLYLLSPKLSASLDGEGLRKVSSCSDFGEELCIPPESDAVPFIIDRHINCGRDYQVKVKKWADRAISNEELDAIPDRDDAVFDCNVIDHLDDSAVEAYELLAYSKAVPRPGRNRELALHLLMENKGNIQEAVLDLMRSDTLDWSQYPIIYNSLYTDTCSWTPEEISFFQDAIYKGEKDFHQVAIDLGNKTVKQCVEFYYLWKKACPDDYRKLRNLRRKRQLLEMQQQLDLVESYNLRSNTRPTEKGELSGSEDGSDLSESSHDAVKIKSVHSDTNTSCSPLQQYSATRFAELPHSSFPPSLVAGTDGASRSLTQLHRTPAKKGAQPAADGFFHCRLCEKYFEKVKSLNAHMKSHAMKARAEAEAAQTQLSLRHHGSNINSTNAPNILEKTMSTKSSPGTDSLSFVHHHHNHQHHQKQQQQNSLNNDLLKVNIERPTVQVTNNLPAASDTAAVVPSEQHPFSPVVGKSGAGGRLSQDLFLPTSLAPEHHQFTQNTLISGSLGLAAHQALNQSLTAASVLNQFPQAQALQFLSNLQNPAITH
uniref:Uncharacterized protein n=1 Tax=Setaria digitata TaxID=48799 RepID=A0A915PNM1_9BILA